MMDDGINNVYDKSKNTSALASTRAPITTRQEI
jgi:hypothetical protein